MVKYLKLIIVATCTVATIFLSGCEKEFFVPDTTVNDIQSAVIKKMGFDPNPADLNLWISGSRASIPLNSPVTAIPTLTISAYTKE